MYCNEPYKRWKQTTPKKRPPPKKPKTTRTKNNNKKQKQEEIVIVEEKQNKKRIQYSCVLDLQLQNCIVIDIFCKIHLCNLYLRKHGSYWPLLRERNCPFPIFKSTFTFSETLFSYEIQYHSNWMYDGAIRSSTDSQCLSDDHLVSQSHEVKMWLKNWA